MSNSCTKYINKINISLLRVNVYNNSDIMNLEIERIYTLHCVVWYYIKS